MHAALRIQSLDCFSHIARESCSTTSLMRFFLPHDLVEPRVSIPLLGAADTASCFDGFMLARVTYQQYAVVFLERWRNSFICFVLAKLDSSRT